MLYLALLFGGSKTYASTLKPSLSKQEPRLCRARHSRAQIRSLNLRETRWSGYRPLVTDRSSYGRRGDGSSSHPDQIYPQLPFKVRSEAVARAADQFRVQGTDQESSIMTAVREITAKLDEAKTEFQTELTTRTTQLENNVSAIDAQLTANDQAAAAALDAAKTASELGFLRVYARKLTRKRPGLIQPLLKIRLPSTQPKKNGWKKGQSSSSDYSSPV